MPSRKRKSSEDVEKAKAIMEAAAKEDADRSVLSYGMKIDTAAWDKYVSGALGNLQLTPPPAGWYVSQNSIFGPTPNRAEIDRPKAGLPKSESTEVITGYRMWPLTRSFPEGYRLGAANAQLGGKIIPNEKLVAECKADTYGYAGISAGAWFGYGPSPAPTPKRHDAPHEGCQCGIHAYSKSVPLEPSAKPYAAGEVYLWGKVIVHEHGFRAQFAYPKRLYIIDGGPRANKIADALELTYGVPCSVWDG